MAKFNDAQLDQQKIQHQEASELDLLVILPKILKNWYWFIIAIVIALFFARFYINHTLPVYRTSSTILINEPDNRPIVDNSELLQGLGLPGGLKKIQNQIKIIESRALTERTLGELPYEIDYYVKTIRNKLPLYPEIPLRLFSSGELPLPKDTEFSVSYLGDNMYRFESESKYFPFQVSGSFGEIIEMEGGSFTIECLDHNWFIQSNEKKVYLEIHSLRRLISDYSKRIQVELLSREGSVLRVSLEGTNRDKDVDFINNHIEGFQAISLDKKNAEAQRRIQFIDDQLVGISESLTTTENTLQQFRSSHKVMDLSVQGQSLIGQLTILENEKARLNLEANYYDYLIDYLAKDVLDEIPIVPITMGITDPSLTKIVEELTEFQGQLSARGAGEMNPLQRNLEQRIRSSKGALKETLNGLRRANSLARSENQAQINKANAQASTLPVTERQLLGIERKFKLNDELYTFLLETRAEQEMQRASNRADSEVIDPADSRFSTIVSPNRMLVILLALFTGLAIPITVIILRFIFNKTLKEEEIKKISHFPVLGYIPHSTNKSAKTVFENPNSTISEAYRLLRSRMQFFTKEAKSPVILITSTMPEDGKTLTAINLASVYSMLGKKTILIGFDLRKPKIFQDFDLNNEKGVSTWLIGQHSVDDIIQETSYENLSIISAGPIPPNPSELTALSRTDELLRLLKESFDYIIIDSSPIGIVSDTYHLASLADTCLLVVRPGKTLRALFEATMTELEVSGTRSISLVVNDIQSDSRHYGGKYGYVSETENSKKQPKKKK